MADVINIILGLKNNESCLKLSDSLGEMIAPFLKEHRLGVIANTFSREELDRAIESGLYQACMVLEKMDNQPIGQGAIKAWRKVNDKMKIVILMGDEKRSSAKAKGLYDIEYYNGTFISDMKPDTLAYMFEQGRSKEEAYKYYDLDNFVPIEKKKKKEVKKTDEEEKNTDEKISVDTTEIIGKGTEVTTDGDEPKHEDILNSDVKHEENTEAGKEENSEPSSYDDNKVEEVSNDVVTDENIEEESVTDITTENEVVNEPINTSIEDNNITKDEVKGDTVTDIKEDSTEDSKEGDETDIKSDDSDVLSNNEEPLEKDDVNSNDLHKDNKDNESKDDVKTEEALEDTENAVKKERVFTDGAKEDNDSSTNKKAKVSFIKSTQQVRKSVQKIMQSEEEALDYFNAVTANISKQEASEKTNLDSAEQLVVATLERYMDQYEVVLDDAALGTMKGMDLEDHIFDIINSLPGSSEDKQVAYNRFMRFVTGYDFLEDLITNDTVTDIHVLDAEHIRVKRNSERASTNLKFYGTKRYERFCRQLLLRNRDRLNSSGITSTYTDDSFSDKYFLQVSIVDKTVNSYHEPELLIRKTLKKKKTLTDLVGEKKIKVQEAAYLIHEIIDGSSMIISGAPSSAKSTLMNALIDYIPNSKSGTIIQYRDELIAGTHPEMVVQHPLAERVFEEGVGKIRHQEAVTIEKLSQDALDKDNDYYILGDVKGKEAVSFYKAITSGKTGWTCITALDPKECMNKLVGNIAGLDMDIRRDIKETISEKIRVIVIMKHYSVDKIYRVIGSNELGEIEMESVF